MRDPAPHCSPKHQLIFALKHLLYLWFYLYPSRQRMSSAHQEPATCNMLNVCSAVHWIKSVYELHHLLTHLCICSSVKVQPGRSQHFKLCGKAFARSRAKMHLVPFFDFRTCFWGAPPGVLFHRYVISGVSCAQHSPANEVTLLH